MRFITFVGPQGVATAGMLLDDSDQAVDLSHPACKALMGGTPATVQALLEQGIGHWVQRLGEATIDTDALRLLSDIELLAPLPRPGKIVGAAFNFTDALAERGMAHPSEPVTFVRSGCTVIGPGAPIYLDRKSTRLNSSHS